MNHTAPSAPAFASRVYLRIATLLCLSCTGILAQPPAGASGDYTDALPSVQRVMTQIPGTDPTDTLARQVAVIEYLQVYIDRIKSTRDYRGSYSPAELRLLTDYRKAQYDLVQAFKAESSPATTSRPFRSTRMARSQPIALPTVVTPLAPQFTGENRALHPQFARTATRPSTTAKTDRSRRHFFRDHWRRHRGHHLWLPRNRRLCQCQWDEADLQ